MELFFIHPADWNSLEQASDRLRMQFERYLDREVLCLSPVLYAEYSCLTQYVEEEIDLVISGQMEARKARLDFHDFISFWGWESKLRQKVYELSGGWRKLLCLSLFVNRQCNNLLFIDFASHLSDESMQLVIRKICELRVERLGFVEYDFAILQKNVREVKTLNQVGDVLEE